MSSQGWQLAGHGPEAYDRYLVPVFFAPCAEQLLARAAVGPGDRVLDVACGTGIVARLAAGRVGAAGTVVGTDVNEGMLTFARAVTDAPGAIDWRGADAASLPYSDGAFDVACCQQGLQFFADRPGALREMRRVLAPGGRAALAVWRSIEHHPAFVALVDVLDQHAGPDAAAIMGAPFAGPGRDELRQLLGDAGFDEARIRIGLIEVRFPSPRDFLLQEVLSSPLVRPVGALDDDRREALVADLDRALTPYADDDGIAFAMQTWFAVARRS